jgi:hypothetical protein
VFGRLIKGNVDPEQKSIFCRENCSKQLMNSAAFALEFYESQLLASKRAVAAWTVIGKRFNVVKDVRLIVARMIWEVREECFYRTKLYIK